VAQLFRVGGGGARHGARFGHGGQGVARGQLALLVARLQPVQRLHLDLVAQVGPAQDENQHGHRRQADQGQRVVADFEQAVAHVATEHAQRSGAGSLHLAQLVDDSHHCFSCWLWARIPCGSARHHGDGQMQDRVPHAPLGHLWGSCEVGCLPVGSLFLQRHGFTLKFGFGPDSRKLLITSQQYKTLTLYE